MVSGVGTLLFSGTDLALNTDFQTKFEEIMKDKEPSRPETWQGDLWFDDSVCCTWNNHTKYC